MNLVLRSGPIVELERLIEFNAGNRTESAYGLRALNSRKELFVGNCLTFKSKWLWVKGESSGLPYLLIFFNKINGISKSSMIVWDLPKRSRSFNLLLSLIIILWYSMAVYRRMLMLRFLSLKGCSFSDRDIFFALLSTELWDCSIRLAFCDTFISFGLQTTNLFSYINTFLSNLWGVTNLVLSHESLKFIV